MSARLLKKVLNQQHQLPSSNELDGEDLESPESPSHPTINPFDLLNDDDEDEDDDLNQSHGEDELSSANVASTEYKDKKEQSLNKNTTAASMSAKKSKKKKKIKGASITSKEKVETDFDLILENLSLDGNVSREHHPTSNSKVASNSVRNVMVKPCRAFTLQMNPKYLNAENELRRIFGSKVVKSFESSNQAGSSRQIRGRRPGNHTIRKTVLVTPANHWPRWDGSLSMEFLETRNGYNFFRYVVSSSYYQAQRAFEAAKAINDLNGLASLLLYHPYHLDSLLTMSEYFKVVGEQQMSSDAIAKCLYALECAWNPMFNPLQGNCQLKFSHDTNKPMFTALFNHMKNLDRRGCHRSALEVCKLLLFLDSDDPMGALFCIDYYCLRSEEYKWLEKFAEYYKSDNSLWLFPNFSYSLAICRFHLEQEAPEEACSDADKATSADLMKQALMLHPSVLKKLVTKVPLKDRVWSNILKNAFFWSDHTGSSSLDHLTDIYVERNYLIWRVPDVQKLLSDTAQQVLELLENKKSEVQDWACVRKEAFSSNKNEYAHLFVSDFSDSVSSIPPENLQNFMVDPRIRDGMQNENQGVNPHGYGHAPRDVANRNALVVLFESMLPWITYGDGDSGEAEDNELHGHDQGHGDI